MAKALPLKFLLIPSSSWALELGYTLIPEMEGQMSLS